MLGGYDFLNVNCIPIVVELEGCFRVFLMAIRDIKEDDHIFYSYGSLTNNDRYLTIDAMTSLQWTLLFTPPTPPQTEVVV